jgi:hypothetical protein
MRLSGDADQFYKASRFGGVAPNLPMQGSSGSIVKELGKASVKGAGGIRKLLQGDKLNRVTEWYKKQQKGGR